VSDPKKRPYSPPTASRIPWPRLRLERVSAVLNGQAPWPSEAGPLDHPIAFLDEADDPASEAFVRSMLETWPDLDVACAFRLPITDEMLAAQLKRRS
jgi:hypothetical protein